MDNKFKIISVFVYSAGALLLITAVAKLISSVGNARILETPDPILAIPFREVFVAAGILEFFVALACFFSKRIVLQVGLVAWMATSFLIYRLGLLWIGYHRPCPCLGNLTDKLHIPSQTADTAIKIILAYLLIGSYTIIFWLWRQNWKATLATPPSETPVPNA
jgi:hypothetical protein